MHLKIWVYGLMDRCVFDRSYFINTFGKQQEKINFAARKPSKKHEQRSAPGNYYR